MNLVPLTLQLNLINFVNGLERTAAKSLSILYLIITHYYIEFIIEEIIQSIKNQKIC